MPELRGDWRLKAWEGEADVGDARRGLLKSPLWSFQRSSSFSIDKRLFTLDSFWRDSCSTACSVDSCLLHKQQQQVRTGNTRSPRCSTEDYRKADSYDQLDGNNTTLICSYKHLAVVFTPLIQNLTVFNTNGSFCKHQHCSLEQTDSFCAFGLCESEFDYMCDSAKNIFLLVTEHFRLGKNECSGSFTKEPKAAGKEPRWKLQTLVSIATHTFITRVWPRQCSMSIHAGFEVLVLLLDLRKALIQLHIFVSLQWEQTKRNEDSWGQQLFPICTSSYQLFQFHQLLLLLVELLGFDIQNHFEAVQLLFQVQSVGVSLSEPRESGDEGFR